MIVPLPVLLTFALVFAIISVLYYLAILKPEQDEQLSLRRRLTLVILSQGDASLRNNYHVYAVNPARHPRARRAEARAFIDFLVSDAVQRTIATFRRDELGESLFFPDALAPSSTR